VLFKLLGAPLGLPLAGVKFVFRQLADLADQELNDESVLREQFLLLQVEFEEGDIGEDEYAEREAVLLARLRDIKARQRAELEQVSPDELPAEANVSARRRVVVETPFDE
jgi:hypothetical protein